MIRLGDDGKRGYSIVRLLDEGYEGGDFRCAELGRSSSNNHNKNAREICIATNEYRDH